MTYQIDSVSQVPDRAALNKIVEPDNIANVVAFLLPNNARAITRHMKPVDAGYFSAMTFLTFAGGQPWSEQWAG